MNENLNLVEILKDCPKGTKLYSTVFGEVKFGFIEDNSIYPIVLILLNGGHEYLTSDGKLYETFGGECILFPSKDQRDWSKFKPKKPKFNPKTLQVFDKVLVFFNGIWSCDFYSHYNDDIPFHYVCLRSSVNRIIPYNDETKHLLGTSDEAPEYYRYWED